MSRFLSYAALVIVIAGGAIWYIIDDYYDRQEQAATTTSSSQVVMYKNPDCRCCTKWATQMEQSGFTVVEKPTGQMPSVKADHGVPYDMSSCHTALVGGYVVEGHVPPAEVKKLLKERPDATGLAVPGMPVGSPGMESANGYSEPYQVMLFGGTDKPKVYANY